MHSGRATVRYKILGSKAMSGPLHASGLAATALPMVEQGALDIVGSTYYSSPRRGHSPCASTKMGGMWGGTARAGRATPSMPRITGTSSADVLAQDVLRGAVDPTRFAIAVVERGADTLWLTALGRSLCKRAAWAVSAQDACTANAVTHPQDLSPSTCEEELARAQRELASLRAQHDSLRAEVTALREENAFLSLFSGERASVAPEVPSPTRPSLAGVGSNFGMVSGALGLTPRPAARMAATGAGRDSTPRGLVPLSAEREARVDRIAAREAYRKQHAAQSQRKIQLLQVGSARMHVNTHDMGMGMGMGMDMGHGTWDMGHRTW